MDIAALTGQDVFDLFSLKFLRRGLLKSEQHTVAAFHRIVQEQIYNLESEEQFLRWRLEEIQREKAALRHRS